MSDKVCETKYMQLNALGSEPQLTTSSRLLKLGETIDFHFYLPSGAEVGDLA